MKGMLTGVAALVVGVGCGARTLLTSADDTSGDAPDSTGVTADGASGLETLVPLMPNPEGQVSGDALGITGSWYAWGDGWLSSGPPGLCETSGKFSTGECSSILFPSPETFPQSTPGAFCLKGTAAQVIGSPLDYADIYGIGIGLDLNNSGGVKGSYDAIAHRIVGFQFDIANVPTATGAEVRVELPTPETSMQGFAYWGLALTNPVPNGGKNVRILFSDLGQLFPSMDKPPPFNPADLLSIEFYVPSNETNPIPVHDLCVSNLQAIVAD